MDTSSPAGQDRRKTCFLSGSASARITAEVRSVLDELGVTVRISEDIAQGGNIASSIIEAVLSADFVCIVLSTRKPPLAVMYEAGVAAGSFRPLVVIVNSRFADEIPVQLISAPIIRYVPGSIWLLRENLSAYVEQVQPIAAQLTENWSNLSRVVPVAGYSGSKSKQSVAVERIAQRFATAG